MAEERWTDGTVLEHRERVIGQLLAAYTSCKLDQEHGIGAWGRLSLPLYELAEAQAEILGA